MNEKLTKKLVETYPILFKRYGYPPNISCMHWGINCDDGWYDLIDGACKKLSNIDGANYIRFEQVKEKLGALRVYMVVNNDDYDPMIKRNWFQKSCIGIKRFFIGTFLIQRFERVWNEAIKIISETERLSEFTCMRCGKVPASNKYYGMWVMTLCSECESAERSKDYGYNNGNS